MLVFTQASRLDVFLQKYCASVPESKVMIRFGFGFSLSGDFPCFMVPLVVLPSQSKRPKQSGLQGSQ